MNILSTKTAILVLLSIAIFKTGFAQITVTTSDMPVAGQAYILSSASPLTSIDTSIGAGQTWDFSSLISTGQTIDTFHDKSTMPVEYLFLFAKSNPNLGEKTPDVSFGSTLSLTNAYNLYKNSSAKFEQVASVGELNGLPLPNYYSPVDVWYNFPLQFGDTATSHSGFADSIPTIGFFSQKQVRKNLVDGWGTLILPMGSFDVIRVKSTLMDHDSLYSDLFGFGLPYDQLSYQYKFIGKAHGVPLLEIDESSVLGIRQVSSITYQDTLKATGVLTNIFNTHFQSFPNPATNNISIFTDNGRSLKVIDITGRVVFSTAIEKNEMMVDITSLANGIYVIAVTDKAGKMITRKLIIQHTL